MRSSNIMGVLLLMTMAGDVVGSTMETVLPLTCWSCTEKVHGTDCYDLEYKNKTLTKMCTPEERFCMVNRVWFMEEAGAPPSNVSLNRTCIHECSPSCVVLGDRSKIYSCTSCCTSPYCNVGSSASSYTLINTSPSLPAILMLLAWASHIPHHISPN